MRRRARSWIPAILFLLPLTGVAQSSKLAAVEKVADGIWMARTEQGSNVGWFLVGDEVVAVDAGSDAETGKAVLDKIQETAHKPVRYLIVTHAHGDHGGGAGPFAAAGADVICHENSAPRLVSIVAPSSRTKSGLITFSERFAFVGGARRVAVYFLGPAHSAGDIVVFLPDEKLLFSGDVALSARAPYMQSPDMDPKGWEDILTRLSQLDVDKVVPGHGTFGNKQALTDTFGYVSKVNELARAYVLEKVPEDLIEARLRQPDAGIDRGAIAPELIANIRAVMRSVKAKAAVTPAPTHARPPAKTKKG